MKPISTKLRFLITLHVLYKHTDADHRMNSKRLNQYLEPYGLESTYRALGDTVDVLQEFGVDVRHHGILNKHGVWIQDRLLGEDDLLRLVFAVSTNPYLSADEADGLLGKLAPLVSEFQEPLLANTVIPVSPRQGASNMADIYVVIHRAICTSQRLRYTTTQNKRPALFTPKQIQHIENGLCMVGYDHRRKEVASICFDEITSVSPVGKRQTESHAVIQGSSQNILP